MQKILYTNSVSEAIDRLVSEINPSSVHIITDTHVEREVLPRLALSYPVIAVKPGDTNKNIDSLTKIWAGLISQGATRKSLAINIGGGVVTDMGGFAAATDRKSVV